MSKNIEPKFKTYKGQFYKVVKIFRRIYKDNYPTTVFQVCNMHIVNAKQRFHVENIKYYILIRHAF